MQFSLKCREQRAEKTSRREERESDSLFRTDSKYKFKYKYENAYRCIETVIRRVITAENYPLWFFDFFSCLNGACREFVSFDNCTGERIPNPRGIGFQDYPRITKLLSVDDSQQIALFLS